MRAVLVACAVVAGPLLALALSPVACVAQQYDVDAGPDSGLDNCDTFGIPCAECQECVRSDPGWRMECEDLFKACENSDECLSVAACFDRCDTLSSDEKVIASCAAECCRANDDDVDGGGALFEHLGHCAYHRACPFSCKLQDIYNTCRVGDASTD